MLVFVGYHGISKAQGRLLATLALVAFFVMLGVTDINPETVNAIAKSWTPNVLFAAIQLTGPDGFYATDLTAPRPRTINNTAKSHPCHALPGVKDIMVVLRTNAADIATKVPNQVQTNLACAAHYAIYSYVDDVVGGTPVHNILASLSESIRDQHPDFEEYDKLQRYHAQGVQNYTDLVPDDRLASFEKHMYLPLVHEAATMHQGFKWYLFIDADASIIWSTLSHWLRNLDTEQPWFLGTSPMNASGPAASSSAFLLSANAISAFRHAFPEQDALVDVSSNTTSGFEAVEQALQLAAIGLTDSSPLLQSTSPSLIQYSSSNWCSPSLSHQTTSALQIGQLHALDAAWIRSIAKNLEAQGVEGDVVTHGDIFERFVMPQLEVSSRQWNNMASDRVFSIAYDRARTPLHSVQQPNAIESDAHKTSHMCQSACEHDRQCLQWMWKPETCSLGYSVRLGRADHYNARTVSGWMLDRIEALKADMAGCTIDWQVPASLSRQSPQRYRIELQR